MALVAGVLFVFLSFMALRLSRQRDIAAPASTAETMASPETTGSTVATTSQPIEAPSPAVTAQTTAAEPVAPSATTRASDPARDDPRSSAPVRAQGTGATPRHHRNPGEAAPAGQGADLGEFKAKF